MAQKWQTTHQSYPGYHTKGEAAYQEESMQIPNEIGKNMWVAKVKAFLERFTDNDLDHIVFSDEKMFTVAQRVNRQNDRIYSTNKKRKAVFPAKIMVWGAVCSKGVLQIKFVNPGTKVNYDYYQEILATQSLFLKLDVYILRVTGAFSKMGCPHTRHVPPRLGSETMCLRSSAKMSGLQRVLT
jgi:hypothetical protein